MTTTRSPRSASSLLHPHGYGLAFICCVPALADELDVGDDAPMQSRFADRRIPLATLRAGLGLALEDVAACAGVTVDELRALEAAVDPYAERERLRRVVEALGGELAEDDVLVFATTGHRVRLSGPARDD